MARTHLKVIRGRHGTYQVHTREISSEGKAPESIDPAVIVRRAEAAALARKVIDAGYEIKLVKVRARGQDKALYKEPDQIMLRVVLNRPITAGDFKKVEQPAIEAELMKPGAKLPDEKVVLGTFSFLTDTSKMGCYSFNLPAGPTFQGGTCPAAGLGFMFLDAAELRKQQTKTTVLPISVPDYICNACYALKAAYGYTSNVVGQSLKLELTRRWLRSGEFASRMVDFIRAGQINSAERMKKIPKEFWHNIPNPNFFRIHDAGDMFNRAYAETWMEICRQLPDILFWAPTRMWAMEGAAALRFGKGLPPNLALRPSALHLKKPAPDVQQPGTAAATLYGAPFPGLSAGSGSGLSVPAGTWACPAYEHTTKLGGAVFKLSPKGKVIGTKGGNCGRSHGPNSPGRGGNDPSDLPTSEGGNGCRACWRNKDLPIFYHEH